MNYTKIIIALILLLEYNCFSQDTVKSSFELQLIFEIGITHLDVIREGEKYWDKQDNVTTFTQITDSLYVEFKSNNVKEKRIIDKKATTKLFDFVNSSVFEKLDTLHVDTLDGKINYELCYHCSSIIGKYTSNGKTQSFNEYFDEDRFELFEITMNILNSTIKNKNLLQTIDFLANNHKIFFFRIEKLSNDPLTYKLKTLKNEFRKELEKFIKSLKNDDITFDVSELDEIDPKLFPIFKNLINIKNITWYQPSLGLKKILIKDIKVDIRDIRN